MVKKLTAVGTALGLVASVGYAGWEARVASCPETPVLDSPLYPIGIGPTGNLYVAADSVQLKALVDALDAFAACTGRPSTLDMIDASLPEHDPANTF